ncbi:MAG: GNAT family N-acetyltransferase [Bacteroidota bacterium]
MKTLRLRDIQESDCVPISSAFKAQGWNKSESKYREYCRLQAEGIRDIIIAEVAGEFAGYLTILWRSEYPHFQSRGIPEINDFNVLKKFWRQGIGSALMDEAERRVKERSEYCGIGFGLVEDYGAAQILYVKRGYIPDGKGFCSDHRQLQYMDQITVDDSLALYLTKKL